MHTGLASGGMVPPFLLSGWSRGLAGFWRGLATVTEVTNHKRPRCNSYRSVFLVTVVAASVRPSIRFVFAEDVEL